MPNTKLQMKAATRYGEKETLRLKEQQLNKANTSDTEVPFLDSSRKHTYIILTPLDPTFI